MSRELVRVSIEASYLAYKDDQSMVDHAKAALYEDVMNAVKYNWIASWMSAADAPDADPSDIPGFLLETAAEDDEDEESCHYCQGNCPNEPDDSENLCDGFAGDIDGLYAAENKGFTCAKCNPDEPHPDVDWCDRCRE
jgi:CO dehydrogenase/acetyl-CoA synthase alpha subunit